MNRINFIIVMLLTSVMAWADDSGYCGKNVTWSYNSSTKTLTIVGTGAMNNYDNNYLQPWDKYGVYITSVVIEHGVTTIGDNAFKGCINLKSVIIPSSVTSIGKQAFYYCTDLCTVIIPASVTSIGDEAFLGCDVLCEFIVQRYDANATPPITTFGKDVFKCHIERYLTIYVPPTGFESYINATNLSSYKNIIEPAPDLWIGGKLVTDENAEDVFKGDATNDGKVSYDLKTNTLTLNDGTTIGDQGIVNGKKRLTIALKGKVSIHNNSASCFYSPNGLKLKFVKAEGAASVELTATCGNGYVPIEYGSITLGEGLYWKPFYADANATVKSTVITDDPQFVIVGDRVITNGQTISGIQGSISYSESEGEKVLTLTGFLETFGSGHGNMNAIETGVIGLKVKLVGDNYISCEDNGAYAFKGTHDNASIQFIKEGSDSKLTMTTSSSNPLSFGSGKVTYDGLIFLPDADKKYICEPTAPTMSLDNGKVKLTKDYDDGTIYYSIAYADDTPSETGVKYTEPFAITHPGVVTAWVEANNATTDKTKGKKFGYKDAPFTMLADETKTPELIPTIETGDNIGYATAEPFKSSNTSVATFEAEKITASGFGSATLTTTLIKTNEKSSGVVILNPGSVVTFSVYVGELLSNYFIGSNEFCTFYNESDKTYAVPEGMEAYVVTGASGNKLVIVETPVLPANAVVLLKRGTATFFTKIPASGAAPGGNLLKHATADISVTTESSLYVLYNDMYVIASPGIIPTGKNYLDLSPTINAGTRGFYTIGEDEATSLREVKSTLRQAQGPSDDAWYLLDGRKLSGQPTKKGIYIYKGKKVKI